MTVDCLNDLEVRGTLRCPECAQWPEVLELISYGCVIGCANPKCTGKMPTIRAATREEALKVWNDLSMKRRGGLR